MEYKKGYYTSKPIGNNEFSYKKRMNLGSKGKIHVTNVKKGNLKDLKVGNKIVFEEVVKNKLIGCIGLKQFLWIKKGIRNVFIVDNHNHALYFRYRALNEGIIKKGINLVHIDQHSDMKENKNKFNGKDVCKFINEKTNVGNFILPAKNEGLINEVIQVRTGVKLNEFGNIETLKFGDFILDIDMDFWVGKTNVEKDFVIVRNLIKNAKIITIATSPYFLDQDIAVSLVKKLLK